MADQGQKTERPTQRRLDKARKEGRVPTSRDLIGSLQFAAFIAILLIQGSEGFYSIRAMMRALFTRAFQQELTITEANWIFRSILFPEIWSLIQIGLTLSALMMVLQLLTTGFTFSTSQLFPQFSRLNSLKRMKQLPAQNVSAALKALLLVPCVAALLYLLLAGELADLVVMSATSLGHALQKIYGIIEGLLTRLCLLLVAVGVLDFVRQRRRFLKEMRMTKQDVKDEFKETEGNPQMKMRIRRLQRDTARRNMMKAIPGASAVIVNPTHFAVALQYEMNSPSVPRVVAKGKNFLALRIKRRALEHGVPVIENQPLAQALYHSVNLNQDIPPHLYRAVAEVLAYIYRTLQKK